MIGVLAPASDPRVVSEFFELFKTPWEYLRADRKYDVILCVGEVDFDASSARLVAHYANVPLPIDTGKQRQPSGHEGPEVGWCNNRSLVIYGKHLTFDDGGTEKGPEEKASKQLSYRCQLDETVFNRIGYDLFAEIAELLTNGQPADFAQFPTLEIHIALLREMIVESGAELIEIPPVPQGYGCIACLTHDIDHPAIKNHKWDATAFGFLYRATVGSIAQYFSGRITFQLLLKSWRAALKLPLVYAGLAGDFWSGFEKRYSRCEPSRATTYFAIPFRDYAGKEMNGSAPRRRASRYAASEIKDALQRISADGCEVGLHGIDAWHDEDSAQRELNEIRRLVDGNEVGVRMHWLFFDEKSPTILEDAGASYDSTIGYRQTVGFRSGTSQAYKPIEAKRLLELPLNVMDTALFYPAYLGCSQRDAESYVRPIIESVVEFGGCLTVNWHDRSLAAERNWESSYLGLVNDLTKRNAWFATGGQAAAWFRMRRAVVFETDTEDSNRLRITEGTTSQTQIPGMTVRVCKLEKHGAAREAVKTRTDLPFEDAVRQERCFHSVN